MTLQRPGPSDHASVPTAVHLDLDGAWGEDPMGIETRDVRAWGPRLRYCAPRSEVEAFDRELGPDLPPFILYGSGDYHYLAGLWVRRAGKLCEKTGLARPGSEEMKNQGGLTVVSFDNHPDWDVRPPYWACGGWICRALEMPHVAAASVWGCGNFELAWPARLFANRAALSNGRLAVHAWAERQKPAVCRRFNCMTGSGWRDRFDRFALEMAGRDLYVTVDLDCLAAGEAVTNWENGLFTADDVGWAIATLRGTGRVVAGDLCGAWSPPEYARRRQRFAGNWDHPKLPSVDPNRAREINHRALATIWPVLIGSTTVR